ncbi:hypothetical protein Tco_1062351 [Tanacetum coccineum]
MTSARVTTYEEDREAKWRPQLTTPLNPTSNVTSNSQTYFIIPMHPATQAVDKAFVMANYIQLEPLLRKRIRELRLHGVVTCLNYSSEDVDKERELEPLTYEKQKGEGEPCHRGKPQILTEAPRMEFNTTPKKSLYIMMVNMMVAGQKRLQGKNYEQDLLWPGPPRGRYGYDEESPSLLTRWIKEFKFPDGLKVLPHVGYYDGKGDPYNFIHVFEGAMRMEKWVMPVTCHMFIYILKDAARVRRIKPKITWQSTTYEEKRAKVSKPRYCLRRSNEDGEVEETASEGRPITFMDSNTGENPPKRRPCEGSRKKIEKGGTEVGERRKDVYTTLSGFFDEQVNPLGEIGLQITVGEAPHHRSEHITFLIVQSDSPQHMLFGRTAIAELGMIPSTMYSAVLYQ